VILILILTGVTSFEWTPTLLRNFVEGSIVLMNLHVKLNTDLLRSMFYLRHHFNLRNTIALCVT